MEYLSVKEFAEAAGVTIQYVYQRIKKDLPPFVKEENGVKLIKAEALELFKSTKQAKQTTREQELEERIKELEALNQALTADKVSLLEKLTENNTKLLQILEQQMQLQENYQILIAQTQQVNKRLTDSLETIEEPLNKEETVESNLNKRSLINWLFRRK